MAKTASISMEIDSGIKERAMAVLEARGMSLSGAVRRMVTLVSATVKTTILTIAH